MPKNKMWLFVTIVGFLLLVSLAILDPFPTYHQENVGKNISFPPCEQNYVILYMKTIGTSPLITRTLYSISSQRSISIFPENVRKPEHYCRNRPKNSIT